MQQSVIKVYLFNVIRLSSPNPTVISENDNLDFGAPAFNDAVATASASVASVSIDKMFGSDINGEAIAANTLGSFIGNQLAAQAKQHYADYQAKKAFEAELKISQIPTIHQEIEASERRFIQSIAAHPNDHGSAPSSPQSSQGGSSRAPSAKSTPPHKPQGNAGNSGGSDAVSFEASRSHVEVASAQREKHMSRAQRWNEESHRAKTQPPRSSQASKNGFWSVLEEMGDSRFIAMVNEVGNSLNPFITIPRDVGDAVHAFQSGQTADGFKAVGSALLDATVVLPIDGVVVKGIGYGAKGVAGLGSKVGVFGKTAGSVEHLTTKERVLGHIADSREARKTSNFAVYGAKEDQILAGYNADAWSMTHLNKGDIVYGGLPGQSSYYTSERSLVSSGYNRNNLFSSLQVKPDPIRGYRPSVGVYEVQQTVRVPKGIIKANPNFGVGGGDQFFIKNFNNTLKLTNRIELEESYGLSAYRSGP